MCHHGAYDFGRNPGGRSRLLAGTRRRRVPAALLEDRMKGPHLNDFLDEDLDDISKGTARHVFSLPMGRQAQHDAVGDNLISVPEDTDRD